MQDQDAIAKELESQYEQPIGIGTILAMGVLSQDPQMRAMLPYIMQGRKQALANKQRASSQAAMMTGMQEIQGLMQAGDIQGAQQAYSKLLGSVRPEYAGMATNLQKQIAEGQQRQQSTTDMAKIMQLYQKGDRQGALTALAQAPNLSREDKTALMGHLKLSPQGHGTGVAFADPLMGQVSPLQEIPGARESVLGLESDKSGIQATRQKEIAKYQSGLAMAEIGAREASQKRVFDYQQLNELPPPELQAYGIKTGIPGSKPLTQWGQREAEAVLGARYADQAAAQAMQGAEAARIGVESRPLPESTQKRIETMRQFKRSVLTVEANFDPRFVGKGFANFSKKLDAAMSDAEKRYKPGAGDYTSGSIAGGVREFFGGASEQEVVFRRGVADIADMLLRARSGAQINEQEYQRLKGIMPNLTDEPATFIPALQRVIAETEATIRDAAELAKTPAGGLSIDKLIDVGPIYKPDPPPMTPKGRKMGQ